MICVVMIGMIVVVTYVIMTANRHQQEGYRDRDAKRKSGEAARWRDIAQRRHKRACRNE